MVHAYATSTPVLSDWTMGSTWTPTTHDTTTLTLYPSSPRTTYTTLPVERCVDESGPPPENADQQFAPNIHEFFRQLPKHLLKNPRVEIPQMTRIAHVQKSMLAQAAKPLPLADNNNKHKEFFNRNAMVRVFCKN